MKPTIVYGVDRDRTLPYAAMLNGPTGPVQLPADLVTPEPGSSVKSGPAGVTVPFDPADPVAVFVWLSGATDVVTVVGPSLLPDVPGDLLDGGDPARRDGGAEESAPPAEEAANRPKGRSWPGWERDQQVAEHWADALAESVGEALDGEQLAGEWLASPAAREHARRAPETVEEGAGQIAAALLTAGLVWLIRKRRKAIRTAITPVLRDAATEGWLVGTLAADHVLAGDDDAAVVAFSWPDDWEPGDADAARKVLGDRGDGQGLRDMLADSRVRTIQETDKRFEAFARLLARAVAEGWPVDQLAAELVKTGADRRWAYVTAQTEIARAISQAALDTYRDNGIDYVTWEVAGRDPEGRIEPCGICLANAARGPVRVGERFPSGHASPPGHPGGCRCSLAPWDDLG